MCSFAYSQIMNAVIFPTMKPSLLEKMQRSEVTTPENKNSNLE